MTEYNGDITTNRGVVVRVHIENVGDLASLSFRDGVDDRGLPVLKLGKGDRRKLIDLLTESLPAAQPPKSYEDGVKAGAEARSAEIAEWMRLLARAGDFQPAAEKALTEAALDIEAGRVRMPWWWRPNKDVSENTW